MENTRRVESIYRKGVRYAAVAQSNLVVNSIPQWPDRLLSFSSLVARLLLTSHFICLRAAIITKVTATE